MARPQDLPDDLAAVRSKGITAVISLLEPVEAAKIGLAKEAAACSALGLRFQHHPIRDMHLPERASFQTLAAETAARIRSSEHIAVHCYASIGRSGMLACTVLGHFGYTTQAAIAYVTKMRGACVPDTLDQAEFIRHIMTLPPESSFFR